MNVRNAHRSIAIFIFFIAFAIFYYPASNAWAKNTEDYYKNAAELYGDGRYHDALNEAKDGLNQVRTTNNDVIRVALLNITGLLYGELNKYKDALDNLYQALAISRKIDLNQGEILTLLTIGDIYSKDNKHGEALEYFREALKKAKDTGSPNEEGDVLVIIGKSYMNHPAKSLEYYRQSLNYHQRALKIFQKTEDIEREERTLSGIGEVYRLLGKHDRALSSLSKSLELNSQTRNRINEGLALSGMGSVYADQGKCDKAEGYYNKSLEAFESSNYQIGIRSSTEGINTCQDSFSRAVTALKNDDYDRHVFWSLNGASEGDPRCEVFVGVAYLSEPGVSMSPESSKQYFTRAINSKNKEAIKVLQRFLQQINLYSGEIDGVFGGKSYSALNRLFKNGSRSTATRSPGYISEPNLAQQYREAGRNIRTYPGPILVPGNPSQVLCDHAYNQNGCSIEGKCKPFSPFHR